MYGSDLAGTTSVVAATYLFSVSIAFGALRSVACRGRASGGSSVNVDLDTEPTIKSVALHHQTQTQNSPLTSPITMTDTGSDIIDPHET